MFRVIIMRRVWLKTHSLSNLKILSIKPDSTATLEQVTLIHMPHINVKTPILHLQYKKKHLGSDNNKISQKYNMEQH